MYITYEQSMRKKQRRKWSLKKRKLKQNTVDRRPGKTNEDGETQKEGKNDANNRECIKIGCIISQQQHALLLSIIRHVLLRDYWDTCRWDEMTTQFLVVICRILTACGAITVSTQLTCWGVPRCVFVLLWIAYVCLRFYLYWRLVLREFVPPTSQFRHSGYCICHLQ